MRFLREENENDEKMRCGGEKMRRMRWWWW